MEINYMLMEEEGLAGRKVRQEYLRGCYDFECICRACTLEVVNTAKFILMIISRVPSWRRRKACGRGWWP